MSRRGDPKRFKKLNRIRVDDFAPDDGTVPTVLRVNPDIPSTPGSVASSVYGNMDDLQIREMEEVLGLEDPDKDYSGHHIINRHNSVKLYAILVAVLKESSTALVGNPTLQELADAAYVSFVELCGLHEKDTASCIYEEAKAYEYDCTPRSYSNLALRCHLIKGEESRTKLNEKIQNAHFNILVGPLATWRLLDPGEAADGTDFGGRWGDRIELLQNINKNIESFGDFLDQKYDAESKEELSIKVAALTELCHDVLKLNELVTLKPGVMSDASYWDRLPGDRPKFVAKADAIREAQRVICEAQMVDLPRGGDLVLMQEAMRLVAGRYFEKQAKFRASVTALVESHRSLKGWVGNLLGKVNKKGEKSDGVLDKDMARARELVAGFLVEDGDTEQRAAPGDYARFAFAVQGMNKLDSNLSKQFTKLTQKCLAAVSLANKRGGATGVSAPRLKLGLFSEGGKAPVTGEGESLEKSVERADLSPGPCGGNGRGY